MATPTTPEQDIAAAATYGGPLGQNLSTLADDIAYYLEQGQTAEALALAESIRAAGIKAICVQPVLIPNRPNTSTTD